VTLAAAALVAFLVPQSESRPVQWRDLSSEAGPLTIPFSALRLFRDPEQLRRYLRRAGAAREPTVDFSSQQLVLITTGPRSSSGYAIDVLSVRERDGKLTVKIRERSPSLGERVDPHVSYPYRLLSLPAGKAVYVDWVGR
jgi:hypothetical protein